MEMKLERLFCEIGKLLRLAPTITLHQNLSGWETLSLSLSLVLMHGKMSTFKFGCLVWKWLFSSSFNILKAFGFDGMLRIIFLNRKLNHRRRRPQEVNTFFIINQKKRWWRKNNGVVFIKTHFNHWLIKKLMFYIWKIRCFLLEQKEKNQQVDLFILRERWSDRERGVNKTQVLMVKSSTWRQWEVEEGGGRRGSHRRETQNTTTKISLQSVTVHWQLCQSASL